MTLSLTRRRFTVAEYYQMAQAGILGEDDRVELIDGEIIEMAPIGPHHAGDVLRLNTVFSRVFREVALVNVQNPIRLGDFSEPQPDVTLLRPRSDSYASGHPTPEDVFLLVEVAETSAQFDRQVKALLYARNGVPEYWIDDLGQETLIVYRDPGPDGYRTMQTLRRGDRIAPLAFPDREIAVTDILGEE